MQPARCTQDQLSVWVYNGYGSREWRVLSNSIALNENIQISIKIPLKFTPECPIKNKPALVQIMAWRQGGEELLSKPMMA